MNHLDTADYVVVALFMLGMLGMGLYFARQQESTEDYFVGGRKMPWLAVGLSTLATLTSTITYLAVPGEVIKNGVGYFTQLVSVPFTLGVLWFITFPFVASLRITSAYEYLERRFDRRVRLLGALLFTCNGIGWMATVVYTAARGIADMTQWNVQVLILGLGLVGVVYTTLGGIRADIWTDVVQAVIMFAGAFFTLGFVAFATGTNLGDWWGDANQVQKTSVTVFDLNPMHRISTVGVALNAFFWHICTANGSQIAMQRIFTLPDLKAARKSALVNAVANTMLSLLLGVCGLALFSFYSRKPELLAATKLNVETGSGADSLFPNFIANQLPPAAGGLLICALLAAAMSTIDSGVNSLSAVTTLDLLGQPSDGSGGKQELAIARRYTVVFGALITVAALGVGGLQARGANIIEILPAAFNWAVGPMGALFFAGMFIRRATAASVIPAVIVGGILALVLALLKPLWNIPFSFAWVITYSCLTSLALTWLLSLKNPLPSTEPFSFRTLTRGASAVLVLALPLLLPSSASAEVTAIHVSSREPLNGGRIYPGVGSYERLRGRIDFSVDPRVPANQPVRDVRLAPRDPKGRVRFSADFELQVPVNRERMRPTLLYDVNNRGGMTAPGMFNNGADDFLMRQGYAVLSSGWIGEMLPTPGRLRLHVPTASRNGKPITGLVRAEMAPDEPAKVLSIAHWANMGSYIPTERGIRNATLTVRVREKDPRTAIPRDQWSLRVAPMAAEGSAGQLPLIELELNAGFQPGRLYELVYEARDPIVQGLGLAGIRDLVSFLKSDASDRNPLRGANGEPSIRKAIGFGVSQSGRLLRTFLHDGFNADESGKVVFEGLFPHVAGGGRGSFNHRFASPTRHSGQHDHHTYPVDRFPFTYGDSMDPWSSRTDGLLAASRASQTIPRIIHTQTSAEYWHRAASLVHTDPSGKLDAELPDNVRVYAFGGAQHGAGSGIPSPRSRGSLSANPTDYRPLLRALLLALDRWITDGSTPPPSVVPRISDGTLAPPEPSRLGWPALPDVAFPTVIHQPEWLDFGNRFEREGIIDRQPPVHRGDYTVLAPTVGPDGNERGMLLLPSVAVPLGTFTGWNLRDPSIGAPTELLGLTGGYIPFPKTPADRAQSGDPRPSVSERYPSHEAYRARFSAHAERLRRSGYILPEDLPRLEALSERLWSAASSGP